MILRKKPLTTEPMSLHNNSKRLMQTSLKLHFFQSSLYNIYRLEIHLKEYNVIKVSYQKPNMSMRCMQGCMAKFDQKKLLMYIHSRGRPQQVPYPF